MEKGLRKIKRHFQNNWKLKRHFQNNWIEHYDNMRKYVFLPHFISFLRPFIRRNLQVLDIGCGKGDFLLELKKNFNLILYGLDKNTRRVGELQKKIDNIKFADAHDLPFDDNFFDLTISLFTIHILGSPQTACNEMERVTKKGGLLFIGYSDQNNYINQLSWKGSTNLKPINDSILKNYLCESGLIEKKFIRFINLYIILLKKTKIPWPFPIILDILSVLLSKLLKKDKYIAYRYLLFKKQDGNL